MKTISRFLRQENGATAVEYAVMLLIIALCLIGVSLLGTHVNESFEDSRGKMSSAFGGS